MKWLSGAETCLTNVRLEAGGDVRDLKQPVHVSQD